MKHKKSFKSSLAVGVIFLIVALVLLCSLVLPANAERDALENGYPAVATVTGVNESDDLYAVELFYENEYGHTVYVTTRAIYTENFLISQGVIQKNRYIDGVYYNADDYVVVTDDYVLVTGARVEIMHIDGTVVIYGYTSSEDLELFTVLTVIFAVFGAMTLIGAIKRFKKSKRGTEIAVAPVANPATNIKTTTNSTTIKTGSDAISIFTDFDGTTKIEKTTSTQPAQTNPPVTPAPKKCVYCGGLIPPDKYICPYCGAVCKD